MKKNRLKWKERKRTWFGMPWTFTVYSLSDDRLFVENGIFSKEEKEIRLYRVMDISLRRGFIQRIFRLGTIHIRSNDKDLPDLELKNITDSQNVKEMISSQVESERKRNRVAAREYMNGNTGFDEMDPDNDVDMWQD